MFCGRTAVGFSWPASRRAARLFVFLFREPREAERKGVFSLRRAVVRHDNRFFQKFPLSCSMPGIISGKIRCRAARELLFHQNPLVVLHDGGFFSFRLAKVPHESLTFFIGKLSCGTTVKIREKFRKQAMLLLIIYSRRVIGVRGNGTQSGNGLSCQQRKV